MTHADVTFHTGKSHTVCQDYGVFGVSQEGLARVVIADGCSTSPDTDTGARLLTFAATRVIPFDPEAIVNLANQYRESLGLHPRALDATLLIAQETEEGDAEALVYGDGVVAARRRDGSGYDHWALSFNFNAPEYLSYRLDDNRYREYQANGGGGLTVTGSPHSEEEYIQARLQGTHFHKVFPRAEYDVVLVMTDGVESFQKRDGAHLVPIPLTEVLDQIVSIKVKAPGFIQRRMKRFLTTFCPEQGWQHYDDVTVGGLVLDPTV